MSKFQRQYTVTVQGRSLNTYVFKDPLTLVFNTNRRAFGSLNTASFTIYNLTEATRKDLQFDNVLDASLNGGRGLSFEFKAGYVSEGFQPTLFAGTIQRAFSYREGPNVLTEMQILDGGNAVQYAQVERTRNYPWDPEAELRQLVALMNPFGVTLGAIGSLARNIGRTRGVTWIGSVWDVIRKIASSNGGYACIDLKKAYIMSQNDALAIPGALPVLNASTGLIGTPRRSGWIVDAEMIFEPRVQLMQSIRVESTINPNINGTYSIQSIGQRGVISAAVDGGVITSLSLSQLPESMNLVTPE